MTRKRETTQIFKTDAGIIFLARIFNKEFFEQFQNRDIDINGRCQYCQKLLYVVDEIWTDPDDGSAICEDCYEARMQEKDAEESK